VVRRNDGSTVGTPSPAPVPWLGNQGGSGGTTFGRSIQLCPWGEAAHESAGLTSGPTRQLTSQARRFVVLSTPLRIHVSARRLSVAVLASACCVGLVVVPVSPSAAFAPDGPGGAVTETGPKAPSSGDPTMTVKARKSRAFRATIPRSEWVVSKHAKYVAKRESHNNCRAVSPSGAYRGKWQMGAPFWSAFGGKKYASKPDRATCAEQDAVAYRGWVASWWHPWGG
jgi:hypothetical protein